MERIPTLRAALLALLLTILAAAPAQAQQDVLPDLDQLVPSDLGVERVMVGSKPMFRLGFASASANVGAGPLTLHGQRSSRVVKTMSVDQLVKRSEGPSRVVRDVGVMSYVIHPDHHHWHLLGFEHYELRVPGEDDSPLRRDRKTGFCLGDRFALAGASALPGFNATPLQADMCGLGQPGLLSLFAGISTGWADKYDAQIEGQYIDVTGLPSGQYELVHTVNTDHLIAERDYSNNASSVLFALTWRDGRRRAPAVRVLRKCPNSEACGS